MRFLLLLLITTALHAESYVEVDALLGSRHSQSEMSNNTYGLFVSHIDVHATDSWETQVMGGIYRNSYKKTSVALLAGPRYSTRYVKFGIVAGPCTGYQYPTVLVAPHVSLHFNRVHAGVLYLAGDMEISQSVVAFFGGVRF